MRAIGSIFEAALWQSRFLTLIAVIASFAMWLLMLFITTVDTFFLVERVPGYLSPELGVEARTDFRAQMISGVVSVIDGYLIASALFIFSVGLYRQFISNLRQAEDTDVGRRILDTNSFDALKGRLARVIVLILVVKFLQQALGLDYTTTLDLLLLGFGILTIGGAIYLSHKSGGHEHEPSA